MPRLGHPAATTRRGLRARPADRFECASASCEFGSEWLDHAQRAPPSKLRREQRRAPQCPSPLPGPRSITHILREAISEDAGECRQALAIRSLRLGVTLD